MIADRDRETPPTAATIDAPSWLRPGAPHGESGAPDSESDRAGGDPDAEDIARTPPDDSIDPAPDPAPGAADAAAPDPADDGAAPGAANAAANHAEPDTVVDPPSRPSSRGSRAAPLRRIEQFVLLERIGVGGMGEVFAAFDDKLERKVAIKLVATRGSNDRARERLLREAQALARLSHPNVVTVYEVGTLPDGELFIAMELVKGQTLRAWQRSRAGAWRDIVAKYAEAGRGLAAAHQSGIVHRDFKPDNVLVGDDGRVRVADFGLAFAREDTAVAASRPSRPSGAITVVPASDPAALGLAPTESPATQPGPSEPGALDDRDGRADHGVPANAGPAEPQPRSAPPESPARRLTAPGRFAGTPGYMAPEQLAGAVVDARADQYSFCVALREALDGDRPGAAATERPAAPSATRARHEPTPAWLGELLARGMSDDPGDRFTTMDALLSELTRSRERGRRRAVMVTVAGALAITGAAALMLGGRGDPPPCPPATGELAGVWDAPARQRSAAAILATATPFAPSMWASTSAAFDQYAQRWLGAQQAACEATHVRHVQSATLLDRRMECLASRRRSLAAAAEVLMERPAQAVGHAGELLSSLGDIELCADTGVLLELSSRGGGPMAPASPVARARAAAARQRLASASALLATGDIAGADPAVAETEPVARELADDALGAEVAFVAAQVALARSDVAAATRSFDRAVELAVASHNDELIADIWLARAVHGGSIDQRPAAIEQWIGQSEAWLRRLGHPSDARRIEVERARGSLQYTAGDAHQAVATLSHAIGEAERLWGASDPRLIPMLRERAGAQARLRQARPAVADAERALALGIMAWGTSYPDIARTRRALGLLYIEQLGDVARGEQEIGLALALYRDQLGGDSIEVANCEQALSQAGQYRGDYAAALAHAERAERIYALRLGTEHPRRGEALMGLGVLRFMRRDFAGSLAAYETALPILRAALGATHTTVGILLSNTGETLLALGRAEPARVDFAQALEILRGRLGPDHADLALPLKGLGLAQLIAGRPADARAPLERALALRTQSTAANDPQEVAEIRWALARTLHALGRDRARRRELATAARDGYRGLGPESADRAREIERWLAAAGPARDQR